MTSYSNIAVQRTIRSSRVHPLGNDPIKFLQIFSDFRDATYLWILSTFDSRAFQGVLDGYINGTEFHRLERNSTVQSTERVKIFSRKKFCPESRTLGREEVQGENGVVANA